MIFQIFSWSSLLSRERIWTASSEFSTGAGAEQDAAIRLAQERAEIVAKYDRVSELDNNIKDSL